MKTIAPRPGSNLYSVLAMAVQDAPCQFTFNEWTFETRVGETLGDARQRFKDEHGYEVLTPEEIATGAQKSLEEMQDSYAVAIAAAGVPTEKQMRDGKALHPKTLDEVSAYINSLIERPHDYGTCVYAMSYAAVAAFYFVAHKLGVTGFQASCADMDILRQTRGFEWGRILDYSNLLYPQYCDAEHFPSVRELLADPDNRLELAKRAARLLVENKNAHPDVIAHWKKLIASA